MDFLCGRFVLGVPGGVLLRTLPEVVGLRTAARADCAWLASLVEMMRHEAAAAEPGSPAVVSQLSTALFTLLLRALMADRQVTHGLLALLADPRLSKAVDAVLRAPARAWTVERLAGVCHLSRAAFARQHDAVRRLTPRNASACRLSADPAGQYEGTRVHRLGGRAVVTDAARAGST
jgi:AraC family transcriptional activator of mtrCDE